VKNQPITEHEFTQTKHACPLYLKTISIHDFSMLAGLKEHLNSGSQIILIARIAPLMMKDPEAGFRLIDDIYAFAIEKNYTIFRLGEERIIILPPRVQVISA
jgi:SepF-like predicted cell division protein (DUF552 family)